MIETLIDPADGPERQAEKLLTIASALIRRMERVSDDSGAAYAQFQRASLLEDQVRERTRELERALSLLNATNTRLAEAKAEADTARQNLADAIETIQEGFALFDREDRLVMWNSRFGMHLADLRGRFAPGLGFAEYVGMVGRSAYLSLPGGETPDDWMARRLQRHIDRHVIFNARIVDDHWVQVSEHRTADGGTVILQTDVTEIIRAERQERGKLLDDQARMIRATLDHINQGVAIFDPAGRLIGWNQRLSVLLELPVGPLRMGAPFDQLLARIRAALAFGAGMTEARLMEWVTGRTARAALSFMVRQGDGPMLDVFAQAMPDGGFVMSFTDVTAERAALQALSRAKETLEARVTERTLELQDALADAERANASRSRFVAAASHDLLQPLSAAKLFLSAIEAGGLAPAARTALHKAQNALQSVEGILDALLDISKLESGKAAVRVGPVRLGRLLAQLSEEFAPLAAANGLRLDVLPCSAVVDSDAAYLRRILQNLIGNAIRYTDTGRVLVGARRRAGAVEIEVRDTGPGIPAHAREDIFKEFHRLNARASASEGMGLGLAIVQRACALLDHPLTLDSTLGRGTTFRVRLPRAAAMPAAAPDAAAPGTAPEASGRIVFLVENDVDLRRALGHLLETWGLSVLEAASGEEALDLIEEIGILPDLFLVDQQLGQGMDGLAFLAALRDRHGAVSARLITADRAPALAEAARAAGIGLIQKPIDAASLRAALATPVSGPENG